MRNSVKFNGRSVNMYMIFFFSFTLLILSLCGNANCQTGQNMKDLVTKLFTTDGYKKNVRPAADLMEPTLVDIDLSLVAINGIDEITQKLTTTGYLFIAWQDAFLTWDPNNYGGLMQIYISQDDIWKPDLTLQNGFTKMKELGDKFINAQIGSMGSVFWMPTEVFETKCSIDITYFPFDRQTCNLTFVVWSSSIFDVNVTMGNKGVLLDDLDSDGTWSVVSTTATEDVESSEARVTFSLTLERDPKYYVLNMIAPVIMLGLLSVMTFVLPADSGEKMGYSITVFLAFAVFLTIVTAELPKTSGSLLGYYLIIQLGLGTFVVIITVLELRLHHRRTKVPQLIVKCCSCRCKKKDKVSPVNDGEEQEQNEELDWNHVVAMIDFIMFWVTLIFESVTTVVFYLLLSQN